MTPPRPCAFAAALLLLPACGDDGSMTADAGTDTDPSASGSSTTTSSTTTSSSTTTDGTGTTTTPTDTDTSTGGTACDDADDCINADAPFCDPAGQCVPCDQMPNPADACSNADPNTPVCDAGLCVQCTQATPDACSAQTPICAPDNSCSPCSEHSQCPDSACHLDGPDIGACFDTADVVMVANTTQLNSTLTALSGGDQAVLVLAAGTYTNTATIPSDTEVALIGPSDATLQGGGGFGVNVSANAIAYFSGTAIAGNASDTGLRCIGTSVWLDDTQVRNNALLGLDISAGCAAHLRRTLVAVNAAGGIDAAGGELSMVNSLVSGNGANTSALGGLSVDGVDLSVSYSTIANNDSQNSGMSIRCAGANTGSVRNSIVVGEDPSSVDTCTGLTFTTNAVDEAGLGGTNDNVGGLDLAWFVNPAMRDYHLTPAGQTTFMDIAMWQAGDPTTDFDGDPIPTDMPSFVGYDQP